MQAIINGRRQSISSCSVDKIGSKTLSIDRFPHEEKEET